MFTYKRQSGQLYKIVCFPSISLAKNEFTYKRLRTQMLKLVRFLKKCLY